MCTIVRSSVRTSLKTRILRLQAGKNSPLSHRTRANCMMQCVGISNVERQNGAHVSYFIVKNNNEITRTQSKSTAESLMGDLRISRMNENTRNVNEALRHSVDVDRRSPHDARRKTHCGLIFIVVSPSVLLYWLFLPLLSRKSRLPEE